MVKMENNINEYKYGDSVEDLKLKAFVEHATPKGMDSNAIKQKTFMKIRNEQRRQRRRLLTILSVAACSLVAIVVASVWAIKGGVGDEVLFSQVKPVAEMQHVTVPVGEKMTILLSDGTKLVANSRTELSYPKSFQQADQREISIKGEAYLEVAHDAEHPFVVNSGKFRIRVLGTRFNVSNYDDSEASVVLAQGSVEITTANKDKVMMKPSEKVDIKDGSFVSKQKVDALDYTSWMNGIICLQGENIQDIAKMLSRHYGVKIVCDHTAPTPLYGKLVLQDSVIDVLKTISGMVKMKTIQRGDEIHIMSN